MTGDTVGVAGGLALEHALAAEVLSGTRSSAGRFWRPADRAVVVPRRLTRQPGFGAASEALDSLGYPIVVRESGGDIVPQVPGMLNIAIGYVVPDPSRQRFGIEAAYSVLCEPVVEWLRDQDWVVDVGTGPVDASICDGRFNVVVNGRKLAGTAQRWCRKGSGRWVVFAHAMLFMDVELDALVDVVNTFYRICGIGRHCRTASHTTFQRLERESGCIDPPPWHAQLPDLLDRYHERLSAFDHETDPLQAAIAVAATRREVAASMRCAARTS